jgi:hypothetical protein
MRITEQERKEILSKYNGDTSDELLQHMKRNFPVKEVKLEFKEDHVKFISVDDKSYYIEGNKKYLVNRISSFLEDEWVHLGLPKIRRTVKKYIDGFK